jgi:uncharacterized protein YjiS (DUF1127 family)
VHGGLAAAWSRSRVLSFGSTKPIPGQPGQRSVTMPTLLVQCSALELPVLETSAGSPWWTRLVRAIADKRRTRRAARELHRMNDVLLRDMGLSRCGIEYAVRFGRE